MIITIDTNNMDDIVQGYLILSQMMAKSLNAENKDVNKQTETVSEAPKKEKTTPSKGSTKKAPEDAPTQTEETPKEEPKSSITLDVLKDAAKNAVARTDRDRVKTVISEFGDKLAEVKESDFGKLYKKLQELK